MIGVSTGRIARPQAGGGEALEKYQQTGEMEVPLTRISGAIWRAC